MALSFAFGLLAVAALVPAAAVPYRRGPEGDRLLWPSLALATGAAALWAGGQAAAARGTDFSTAAWLSIAATLACFLAVCARNRPALGLAPLLLPYLALLGLAATAVRPPDPLGGGAGAGAPPPWVLAHAAASILTYALVTLAAAAGLSVILAERALKRKSAGRLSRLLPAVMDAERLEVGLLKAAAAALAAGLCAGMASQLQEGGRLLAANHKTVLGLAAFAAILAALLAHARFGMRGRAAARMALLAWLLLTLGYPGVKFVTEVLLGRTA